MDVRQRRARRRGVLFAAIAVCALAIPAISVALGSSTSPSLLAYVGTSSGSGRAFTRAGTTWTANAAGDLPDVGSSAFPALVDLDGDGVHDALVGNSGGEILAFRNAGSDAKPSWQHMSGWDPAFDAGTSAAPAPIDLDGDHDFDLLVGNTNGDVVALANTGSKSAPAWSRKTAWDLGDVGGYAASGGGRPRSRRTSRCGCRRRAWRVARVHGPATHA